MKTATVKVIRDYVRSICTGTSVVPKSFSDDMWYDIACDPEAIPLVVPIEPARVMLTEAERAVFRKRPDQVELWRSTAVLVMEKVSSIAAARGSRARITTTYHLTRIIEHKPMPLDSSDRELVG